MSDPKQVGLPRQWEMNGDDATINPEVHEAAHEVWATVYPASAAVPRLRFGVGEVIAFLYARSFPKEQWKQRVEMALEGMSFR